MSSKIHKYLIRFVCIFSIFIQRNIYIFAQFCLYLANFNLVYLFIKIEDAIDKFLKQRKSINALFFIFVNK